MNCVRCGYSESRHCRADGSCLDAACPAFLKAWPVDESKPEPARIPLEKLKEAQSED